MSTPSVSCIIPVFNGERFLSEAIESVLSQTHSTIEVIVVDDGSTDGTADVARSFGDRVKYVHQDNAGPVVARNTGLEHATGDYIAFLDSDDRWSPEKVTRQLARFGEDPGLGFCLSHIQNFWEEEMADEEAAFRDHARSKPMPGYVTQTLMARRSAFDQVGGFDPELGHSDATDWFMRAERAGVSKDVLPDVLTWRRMHRNNLSRREATDSREEFLKLVKAKLDAARKQ